MRLNITYSVSCTVNGGKVEGYLSTLEDREHTVALETPEGERILDGELLGSGPFTFTQVPNNTYALKVYYQDVMVANRSLSVSCMPISENPPYVPPKSNPCVASKPFTIALKRYPRYFMQFKQRNFNNHEKACRVEWMEAGYTGEPEEVKGAMNPVHITRQGVGNKIDVIKGSGMTIDLTVMDYTTLKNFYTADERKYRVDYYEDNVLVWQGYHVADIYNEPWISAPFHGSVQAIDGLGALDNMDYVDSAGERYYGRERTLIVLFRCLRKLDLNLPVWCAVNLWENTMNLDVEPLWQTYVDQGGYYDEDNEPISCKEVVERILQPYNAFVTQSGAALHIIRYSETKGPYLRRKALIGTSDATVLIDVEKEEFEESYLILPRDSGGLVSYRKKSQVVISRPAFKYVTTVTEYGNYENFLFNGDFERWGTDKPLFWVGTAITGKYAVQDKFAVQFPNPLQQTVSSNGRAGRYNGRAFIENKSYQHKISSEVGFTFKLDYTITVNDFLPKEGMEWDIYPEFSIEGETVRILNDCSAYFNGVLVNYTPQIVWNGSLIPGAGKKRIDLLYANQNGTFTYLTGTLVNLTEIDHVLNEPDASLLVTYVSWVANEEPTLSSCSSVLAVDITAQACIGDYAFAPKRQSQYLVAQSGGRVERSSVNGSLSGGVYEPRTINASWVPRTRDESYIKTYIGGLTGTGYSSASGTIEVEMLPYRVPGLPTVRIFTPVINRDNLRGVTITIDNASFTETPSSVKNMIITGKNEGHINTKPFELTLKHGSHLPRTQALLTLEDGTPARLWDNDDLLQEITTRDILAQHSRPTLVLTAVLAGYFSPNAILKDEYIAGSRFLVDNYVYSPREHHITVEAQEVFGGVEDTTLPDNVRVTEDMEPRVTEEGVYRVIEG